MYLAAAENPSLVLRVVALLALVPIGLLIALVGYLGWRQRLPRNRFRGVRTEQTLRSEQSFVVANRVAGLPVLLAGLVAIVTGGFAAAMPSTAACTTVAVLGLAGAAALASAGGVRGHRVAAALNAQPSAPLGRAGCSCTGSCPIASTPPDSSGSSARCRAGWSG